MQYDPFTNDLPAELWINNSVNQLWSYRCKSPWSICILCGIHRHVIIYRWSSVVDAATDRCIWYMGKSTYFLCPEQPLDNGPNSHVLPLLSSTSLPSTGMAQRLMSPRPPTSFQHDPFLHWTVHDSTPPNTMTYPMGGTQTSLFAVCLLCHLFNIMITKIHLLLDR